MQLDCSVILHPRGRLNEVRLGAGKWQASNAASQPASHTSPDLQPAEQTCECLSYRHDAEYTFGQTAHHAINHFSQSFVKKASFHSFSPRQPPLPIQYKSSCFVFHNNHFQDQPHHHQIFTPLSSAIFTTSFLLFSDPEVEPCGWEGRSRPFTDLDCCNTIESPQDRL